jgi:hypothetical protein
VELPFGSAAMLYMPGQDSVVFQLRSSSVRLSMISTRCSVINLLRSGTGVANFLWLSGNGQNFVI